MKNILGLYEKKCKEDFQCCIVMSLFYFNQTHFPTKILIITMHHNSH